MLRLIKNLLLLIALLLGAGSLLQFTYENVLHDSVPVHKKGDLYDPSLARLNSMKKLVLFIDSVAEVRSINPDSIPDYVDLADSIIRMRFYHGLQNYRFSDNWIANISGKYLWSHMGAKVLPDDILKGQKAFCSQSAIVFQEFLKLKGFHIRSVMFKNHYCTEVLVNGSWQFHDVSYKPVFAGLRYSAEELATHPQIVYNAYIYSFATNFRENLQKYFIPENITYGKVDAFAAPQMALFHTFTWYLGTWGWAFFLALYFVMKRFFS